MQKEAGVGTQPQKGDPGNLGGALMMSTALCLYQLGELVVHLA